MRYTIGVTVLASWAAADTLRLYVGSEGAADLAGSTPAGGRLVNEVRVNAAAEGAVIDITFDHNASAVCTTLPIGVSAVDTAGNESAKTEYLVGIAQPPRPPGRPSATATANPGEATLAWLASPDL